jgi:hypothetical protein
MTSQHLQEGIELTRLQLPWRQREYNGLDVSLFVTVCVIVIHNTIDQAAIANVWLVNLSYHEPSLLAVSFSIEIQANMSWPFYRVKS